MSTPLSIEKSLRGRHILFTGASGFLGKVWLSMVLDKVPSVGRIYILLRGKKGQGARERFEKMINESYAFQPLHERYGEGLSEFLSERIEVVAGDVSQKGLGIDAKVAARIQRDLDVLIHCAGNVDFNPELSDALVTNVDGTIHAAEFAAGARDAKFVQVSTCFVAGNREGRIMEGVTPNYSPTRPGYDVEAEYKFAHQLVKDIHENTSSPRALEELRAELTKSVIEKGHDPNNTHLIERILRRESKARLTDTLVQAGKDRAQYWGWPNVYTYTKSMAESMLLERFPNLPKAIFRPAITESAVSFPMPGWNEGLNTSGPLVYFMGTWFRHLPAKKEKPLDIVPVDYCCAALTSVAAALLEGKAGPAYQCATSDRHCLSVGRGLELTSLAHRRYYRKHGADAIERVLLSRWDSKTVHDDHFMRAENMRKVAQAISDFAKDVPEGMPEFLKKEIKKLGSKSDRLDRKIGIADKVFDTYKPFVAQNRQTFSCEELVGIEVKEEFFHYEPKKLDWRTYWIEQHVPGLRRWSFPVIDNTKVETYSPKTPVKLIDPPAELPVHSRSEHRALRPVQSEASEVAE
jgi:long-chain acyl-CoA synthetase